MNRLFIFGITSAKGGIESMMHYLIFDLAKNRPASTIFIVTSYREIAFEDEYIDLGVQIKHIPSRGDKRQYKSALKEIFSQMSSDDLAYINLSTFCNWALLSIARKSTCKVLFHGHNSHTANFAKNVLHRIGRSVYGTRGIKVAVSESCDSFMFGGKADHVVYNGIESDRFAFNLESRHDIRAKLQLASNSILVGCLGRISPEKNQLELVKKASGYPDITFVFLGGFMGDKYGSLIQKSASPNCIFLGQIDNVGEYLSALDALIVPSKHEGFPLAVAEALTNGLSVYCFPALYKTLPVSIRDNPKVHPCEPPYFNLETLKEYNAVRETSKAERIDRYDIRVFLLAMEAIIDEA